MKLLKFIFNGLGYLFFEQGLFIKKISPNCYQVDDRSLVESMKHGGFFGSP